MLQVNGSKVGKNAKMSKLSSQLATSTVVMIAVVHATKAKNLSNEKKLAASEKVETHLVKM